jgi:hypothetical protein
MLALLVAGWIATTASPATSAATGGLLPPLHRTTYSSADTRWAWTIDPDRRLGVNPRDPGGGATCSVSHDGVEAGRFHLERVPREVVVSDRGWAVGYAQGPGLAAGEDLVSVVRLEPEGRHELLFEWRGQGRSVPCSWVAGVQARDLRLDPLGGSVSLLLLRADEEWQAWGLAADLPGSPWPERLDARGRSYIQSSTAMEVPPASRRRSAQIASASFSARGVRRIAGPEPLLELIERQALSALDRRQALANGEQRIRSLGPLQEPLVGLRVLDHHGGLAVDGQELGPTRPAQALDHLAVLPQELGEGSDVLGTDGVGVAHGWFRVGWKSYQNLICEGVGARPPE